MCKNRRSAEIRRIGNMQNVLQRIYHSKERGEMKTVVQKMSQNNPSLNSEFFKCEHAYSVEEALTPKSHHLSGIIIAF